MKSKHTHSENIGNYPANLPLVKLNYIMNDSAKPILKFILGFYCLLHSHLAYTQTYKYEPFLNTTDWKVKTAAFGDSSIYWYTQIFKTTIDFKEYTAISYCDSLDPIIYIRESTSSRKVFYMNPKDMIEHILYDFNLKVGDKTYMPLFMNDKNAKQFEVTKIDTIVINGSKRKKFHYYHTGGSGGFEAIECIGCLSEPFKIKSPVFDPVYYLLCAFKGKTLQYSFHQACVISPCYNASSLTDVSSEATQVYPNPCKDKLVVNCPLETGYEIYNLSGKLISQGVVKESIVVSELNTGMYVLSLNREGYHGRFKISKE